MTKQEERPIIFSGTMVKAILESKKTQTRRVVKPQIPKNYDYKGFIVESTNPKNAGKFFWESQISPDYENIYVRCPYGKPGDLLWVRETFRINRWPSIASMSSKTIDDKVIYYRATMDDPNIFGRWKPSIHMPKWAARIWLKITGVRVERVQVIYEDDAIKEGIPDGPFTKTLFRQLWDSINGKKPSCSWADNPWVWVVEFELCR